MVITYKKDKEPKRVQILDEVDLIENKADLLIELAKSNGRLKELEKAIEREKALREKLMAKRYEYYKQDQIKTLKADFDGKLPSMRAQIEIYYARGSEYEEIILLTGAKPEYIHKVVSNYNKRAGIQKERPRLTKKEEEIIAAREFCKTIEQIAKAAGVTKQYVYRVLKKHDIPYPLKKKTNCQG